MAEMTSAELHAWAENLACGVDSAYCVPLARAVLSVLEWQERALGLLRDACDGDDADYLGPWVGWRQQARALLPCGHACNRSAKLVAQRGCLDCSEDPDYRKPTDATFAETAPASDEPTPVLRRMCPRCEHWLDIPATADFYRCHSCGCGFDVAPDLDVAPAPAVTDGAEGRTLEERLADLELRIGAINRFDALEARMAGDGRSVPSDVEVSGEGSRKAVLLWLLAQMRTLRGEA